jgi:hypothetical protein
VVAVLNSTGGNGRERYAFGCDEMTRLIARLRELVDALDRRIPRPDRANEAQIARDAGALKIEALARIGDLGDLT